MIIRFQSISCRSRAPSKIRDGFSPLGNNSCTFVKFLTLGCFCIATVVHSLSCKKGTHFYMDKCTLQRLQMEILYILYICSSRYCIVPQGLKKLQTEIAAFDKQKTEELDRLEQFREEELRKLRCVSFCPNEYQFPLTVIVTSDFLFRSQGPSALTSHRNDGTVSSNILLVNEPV